MGLLGGTVAVLVHRDRVEGERWREAEQAKATAREAVFARGRLGEMLELCREGWTGELNFNYEPVALAWTRQGVDAYFVQGVDPGSLRQVRCNARGVSRGPRVAHPLDELLPAEAPAEAEAKAEGEWPRAHAVAASRSLGEGDLALELRAAPGDGARPGAAVALGGGRSQGHARSAGRAPLRVPADLAGLRAGPWLGAAGPSAPAPAPLGGG